MQKDAGKFGFRDQRGRTRTSVDPASRQEDSPHQLPGARPPQSLETQCRCGGRGRL